MTRRAPKFWFTRPLTPLARLLSPLGALYGAITTRRARRPGTSIGVPVVCVGNAHLGGVGKTPVTLWLLEQLASRGVRSAVVLRGYGGTIIAATRVQPSHSADVVGDEALLYTAAGVPTYVGLDRAASARLAADEGAELIVMDDGLQNAALTKTFALLVYNRAQGLGNGLCFPAGPLRERFEHARARSQAVLGLEDGPVLGDGEFSGTLVLAPLKIEGPVAAFAGIGQPQKFLASLEASGITVAHWLPKGDHQSPAQSELSQLAAHGLPIVCTQKDWVRLSPQWQAKVLPVPASLHLPDGARLLEQITLRCGLGFGS